MQFLNRIRTILHTALYRKFSWIFDQNRSRNQISYELIFVHEKVGVFVLKIQSVKNAVKSYEFRIKFE